MRIRHASTPQGDQYRRWEERKLTPVSRPGTAATGPGLADRRGVDIGAGGQLHLLAVGDVDTGIDHDRLAYVTKQPRTVDHATRDAMATVWSFKGHVAWLMGQPPPTIGLSQVARRYNAI